MSITMMRAKVCKNFLLPFNTESNSEETYYKSLNLKPSANVCEFNEKHFPKYDAILPP